MSEIKKVDQADIENLRLLREQYSEISAKLGQLKIEQLLINQQVDRLKQLEDTFASEYFKLQAEEQKLAEEISKKYGSGQINIDTGEFIPSV